MADPVALVEPKDELVVAQYDVAAIVDKFGLLEQTLQGIIFERDAQIHGAAVALIAGLNMLMVSEPGEGKSYLYDQLMLRIIGARYFKTMLAPHSKPEQVYGPLDLAGLRENPARFEHLTVGYLPWADVAFEDEVYKCNDGLLNGHLTIINEGEFKNGQQLMKVPLSTLFTASNELPKDKKLAAFDDRLHLRWVGLRMQDPDNFKRMLKLRPDPSPPAILQWDEVVAAKQAAAALPIPEEVYDALVDLREKLASENVYPTPRRWAKCINALQAEALLEGCDEVATDHMTILEPCLWTRPDDIPIIQKHIVATANPIASEISELIVALEDISRDIDAAAANPRDAARLGEEIYENMEKAREDHAELLAKAGGSRKLRNQLRRAKDRMTELSVRMVEDVYGLDADTVEPLDDDDK